ncbi:Rv3654c family TadE-like protein [Amycolatopsis sp. NBC_01307]|uniref:Rv3654c family TadE-like protein n=1 Tax=Amycolatopsis sp. NBC_01307 TaxID=2903561 RepID=UPI002E16556F
MPHADNQRARTQHSPRTASRPDAKTRCRTAATTRMHSRQAGSTTKADSGAATIWTAVAVAALTGIAVLGLWLSTVTIARHQVESAADLGAVAAASHASEGPDKACGRARWVTERMGVTLLTCRWQRLDALIEVEAPSSKFAGLPAPSAHARAGPVNEPP